MGRTLYSIFIFYLHLLAGVLPCLFGYLFIFCIVVLQDQATGLIIPTIMRGRCPRVDVLLCPVIASDPAGEVMRLEITGLGHFPGTDPCQHHPDQADIRSQILRDAGLLPNWNY